MRDDFSVSIDANTTCHKDSTLAHQGLKKVTGIVVVVLVTQSCLTLCDPIDCSKNTGVHCHSLIQRIFQTQGLNLGLLHCRQILYSLSYREDKDQIFTESEPERVTVTSHKN